jgi:hypothetical protein
MNDHNTAEELKDAPILLSLHGRAHRPPAHSSDEEFHAGVLARIAQEPPARRSVLPFRVRPLLIPLAAAAMLGGVLFLLLRPEPLGTASSPVAQAVIDERELEWLIGTDELHSLHAEVNDMTAISDDLSGEALLDHLAYQELPLDLILEELPVQ